MSSQSFFVLQNKVLVKQKSTNIYILMLQKLRGKDLNQRPPGYEDYLGAIQACYVFSSTHVMCVL